MARRAPLIAAAKAQGLKRFEWTYHAVGVQHAIRVYEGQGRERRLLWDPETGPLRRPIVPSWGSSSPEFELF